MQRIFTSLSKRGNLTREKSPGKAPQPPTQQPKDKKLRDLISNLFDQKFNEKQNQSIKLDQALAQLAQLLVWAEKHNNELFWELDQLNIFDELFVFLFTRDKLAVLQSLILLITNIKAQYWAEKVIASQVMTAILESEFNQQQNTYLINLLKSMGQRVTANNCQILLQDDHSLFLERCVKLADNEDDMVRTSATNIIMNTMNFNSLVLSHIFSHPSFIQFYFNVVQRFVAHIQHFDKKTFEGTVSVYEMSKQLAEIDDMVVLFQDLALVASTEARNMIARVFYHDVMLAFILPSLSMNTKSSLSLKLGIFILVKVMPVLVKTGYQNQVLKLVLSIDVQAIPNTCWYPHGLSTIQKLSVFLSLNSGKKPDVHPFSLQSARENIITYLTCKDDNIVYLLTFFLLEVIRSKEYSTSSLKECGLLFDQDNEQTSMTRNLLLEILMKQLKPPFRVLTIKNLAVLVVKLAQRIDMNSFAMHPQQIQLFESVYKSSIQEVLNNIESQSTLKAIEYFQIDSRFVQIKGFEIKQKLGRQAFMLPGQENKHLGFYERCPNSAEECARLDLFIFSMLRKVRYAVFPSMLSTYEDSLFSRLYQARASAQEGIKVGEALKPQDKSLKCKMFSNSMWIACLVLDNNANRANLIIAAEEQVASRVIINLKMKELNFEYDLKNQKIVVKVKSYNSGSQSFVSKDDIYIRSDGPIMSQWVLGDLQKKAKDVRINELQFLKSYLQASRQDADLTPKKSNN